MAIIWAGTIVFFMNLLPAFAPPTWMFLSYVQVIYNTDLYILAIVGALSATAGRLVLSQISTSFIRNRILSAKAISNIDYLKSFTEKRRTWSAGIFLFYAFSPFPSNQLFIAYGLTGLPLKIVGLPFLLGRLVSYSFWLFTASEADRLLDAHAIENNTFFGMYFLLAQILTLFTIYLFVRIDWRVLLTQKRLNLVKHAQ